MKTIKKYLMSANRSWIDFKNFKSSTDSKFAYDVHQYIKNSQLDSNLFPMLESMLKTYSDSNGKFQNDILQQAYPVNIFLSDPIFINSNNSTVDCDIKFINWAISLLND